jgi:pilus assembly protein CpaB
MNSKRVVFLLLAVIVAGATAFLARAWLQAERAAVMAQAGVRPQTAAPVKPAVQVLVARNALRAGQMIKAEDLRWQPWPQGNLPPTYIIEGKRSISDFAGAIVRSPLHVGEPVVESELIMPGSRGFLSAVLKPGMRAVSVPATPTSTVSGFIYAGDRVDVMLTHTLVSTTNDKDQHSATETILRNVRVIAVDQKVDFVPGDKPEPARTATLELTTKQAEIVTLAVKMGELSLALRSLQSGDEEGAEAANDDAPAEASHSYTHDSHVSPLVKRPAPPAATGTASIKDSVFVLRGSQRTKQELDGTTPADPGGTTPVGPAQETPKSDKPGPKTTVLNNNNPGAPR